MPHPLVLIPLVLLALTSCIVVVERPAVTTPAPELVTATPLGTTSLAPSLTPLGVVTRTPNGSAATPTPTSALPTALPTFTPLGYLSPTPTPLATSTPEVTAPPGNPTATPSPLVIYTFNVAPAEIDPGADVTLAWDVQAEQVTLWRLDAQGRLSIWYEVPISGTLVVSTPAELRNSVNFVLFATAGPNTLQSSASARIRCPDTWFMPNPPNVCPAGPAAYTTIQAERFERGVMIWTKAADRIYVLYSDGNSPRWQTRANEWFSGMPEFDPTIVPPAGFFQPVRGFGLAWRDEQATPGYRARDRLGWALEPEKAVLNGAVQCEYAPKYVTCYLTGPEGLYVLKPEGSEWSIRP